MAMCRPSCRSRSPSAAREGCRGIAVRWGRNFLSSRAKRGICTLPDQVQIPRRCAPRDDKRRCYAAFFAFPFFVTQNDTPPCCAQAPRRSSFVQYSPSLQRAVTLAGALPNHLATPPWLEQAPCWEAAFDHVLSEQRAVAVFGMRISFFALLAAGLAAGFCAVSVVGVVRAATAIPNANSTARIESVRRICFLQLGHWR